MCEGYSYFDIEGKFVSRSDFFDANKKPITRVIIRYGNVEMKLWIKDNFEKLDEIKEGMSAIFRGYFDTISFKDKEGAVKKFVGLVIKDIRVVDKSIHEALFNR